MSETKPALTPEEWQKRSASCTNGSGDWGAEIENGALVVHAWGGAPNLTGGDRHALAALALHGQPFGFTREDVAELRSTAEDCVRKSRADLYPKFTDDDRAWSAQRAVHFHSLADRIAALLPPREP